MVSFTAFAIGISLLFSSVPRVASMLINEEVGDYFKADYQETAAFKREISACVQDFIAMGTGEMQYGYFHRDAGLTEAVSYGNATIYKAVSYNNTTETAEENEALDKAAEARPAYENGSDAAHSYFKTDLNLLYEISFDGKVKYSNREAVEESRLASEYPFSLRFDGEKAEVSHQGAQLDIYGDGYYRDGDAWQLPGYRNRKSSAEQQKVTIRLWAAGTPARHGDAPDTLYYIQRELRRRANAFQTWCILAVLGAVLFLLSLGWKQRSVQTKNTVIWFATPAGAQSSLHKARAAIASGTGKLPFELKILSLLILMFMGAPLYWMRVLWYGGESPIFVLMQLLRDSFYNGALLCVFWVLYLLINDCHFNGKPWRNTLWSKLRVYLQQERMSHPVMQRLLRQNRSSLLVCALAISAAIVCFAAYVVSYDSMRLLLSCLLLGLFPLPLRMMLLRGRADVQDMGKIAEHIKRVRLGDMKTQLELPSQSALLDVAQALNDIQAGMQAAVAEQVKSERMKVELVTNVSHDLKTPLTSIVSYIDLLKQEKELSARAKEYIKVIDQKAERLRAMVMDIVEISKATSGQLPVCMKPIDLSKLLRQTLADMAGQIDASTVTVRNEIPEDAMCIEADGDRLYRVFQNLIQNALQYSLPGSRVYIALTRSGNVATARIRNVSENELSTDTDFIERFTRGDESRTDGGSGLGLSIASSFTEACGGRFHIEVEADLFTAIVEFTMV